MLEGIGKGITDSITEVLPAVGTVVAAVAGLMFAFKFFKKLTGTRTP